MSRRINIGLAVTCVALLLAMGSLWLAHGQTTNTPPAFQTPLVRDLELVNDLQALTTRVEALEAKVKDLEAKVQSVGNNANRNK